MRQLTDLELEIAYEGGAAECPPHENDEHLYGLRAVAEAVEQHTKENQR